MLGIFANAGLRSGGRLARLAIAALAWLSQSASAGGGDVARGIASPIAFWVDNEADLSDATPGDRLCMSDVGTCTLRAALEETAALANDSGLEAEVHLTPGATYALTRQDASTMESSDGPTALPPLRSVSLALFGNGSSIEARFTERDTFRLFFVDEHASLEMYDIALAGARSDVYSVRPPWKFSGAGGAILNRGRLTLFDCELRDNEISGGIGGGALYNAGRAALWRTGVAANTAWESPGGGIYNDGELLIFDAEIRGNRTEGGDYGAPGGAIFNAGLLVITRSEFRENRIGASCVGGNGAVVYNSGSLSVYDSLFLHNVAETGGNGGAIYNVGSATIQDSVLRDNTIAMDSEEGDGGSGGAVFNGGGMVVLRTTVAENVSGDADYYYEGNGGAGGGVYNAGTIRIEDSTVSGNRSGRAGSDHNNHGGHGGGVFNEGNLVAVNTTVSGNVTGPGSFLCRSPVKASDGGSGGGLFNDGVAILRNVTITANVTGAGGSCHEEKARPGRGGDGGGISNGGLDTGGLLDIANSFVGGNRTVHDGPDCSGAITSRGFNLFGEVQAACRIEGSAQGDLIGETALIWPLDDNGGPTRTHRLLGRSPAVDAGNPNGCRDETGKLLLFDQRGEIRPTGTRCDVGAYELDVNRIGEPPCPGDCDGDANVSVSEVVQSMNIALGRDPVSACPGADANEDRLLTIEELVMSVASAIGGCPLADLWRRQSIRFD